MPRPRSPPRFPAPNPFARAARPSRRDAVGVEGLLARGLDVLDVLLEVRGVRRRSRRQALRRHLAVDDHRQQHLRAIGGRRLRDAVTGRARSVAEREEVLRVLEGRGFIRILLLGIAPAADRLEALVRIGRAEAAPRVLLLARVVGPELQRRAGTDDERVVAAMTPGTVEPQLVAARDVGGIEAVDDLAERLAV